MEISQYMNLQDITGILPEIILLISALVILLFEMFLSSYRILMVGVGLVGLFLSGVMSMKHFNVSQILFQGMMVIDNYTTFFDLLYLLIGIVAVIISFHYLKTKETETRGEYLALILFSVLGMMLMTQGNDLVIVFLGLELLSVSLYILVGFLRQDIYSNESSVKYLLLGAFATGFFLFGVALVYGSTGTTNFQQIAMSISSDKLLSVTLLSLGIGLLLVGFAFKVALFPFHMWSPDVYQGAPTSITAFLSTAPKAAGFGALLKIFLVAFPVNHGDWQGLLWGFAFATMTVGNISALVQSNVKRMLAYSSVAHAGYLCIGVLVLNETGISAVLFYLFIYSIMNLGAFGIIALLEKGEKGINLEDYYGLATIHPWLSAAMTVFMLSLAGLPPTAGFVAKYAIFSSAISKGYIWLIIFAVLNTLISVYYYIRLVINMYMKPSKHPLISVSHPLYSAILVLLVISLIYYGILPGSLIEAATRAALVFS